MDKERTIKKVVEKVERASTTFEKANTELKRKYLKWNIEVFNIIAASVSVRVSGRVSPVITTIFLEVR